DIRKIKLFQSFIFYTGIAPLMGLHLFLNIARKIKNRCSALRAEHSPAPTDKINPILSVQAIFFSKRDVDHKTVVGSIRKKNSADFVFFASEFPQPCGHLARPVADIDRPFGIRLNWLVQKGLRDVAGEHIELGYSRQSV